MDIKEIKERYRSEIMKTFDVVLLFGSLLISFACVGLLSTILGFPFGRMAVVWAVSNWIALWLVLSTLYLIAKVSKSRKQVG